MPYKIVRISGSPVKKGNVDAYMKKIMSCAEKKGHETEIVNLSEKTIKN